MFGIYHLLKYALVEQILGSLDEFFFQAGISGKFWYDMDHIGHIQGGDELIDVISKVEFFFVSLRLEVTVVAWPDRSFRHLFELWTESLWRQNSGRSPC